MERRLAGVCIVTTLCIGSSDRPERLTRGIGVCPECHAIVPLNGNYGLLRHYVGGKKLKGRGAATQPRNWNEE